MVTRIRKSARPRFYIKEHREHLGLTLEQVAGRVGVERNTIWRWENDQRQVTPDKAAALADALSLPDWTDLTRPPGVRSIDAMLADQPADIRDTVLDIAERLIRRAN